MHQQHGRINEHACITLCLALVFLAGCQTQTIPASSRRPGQQAMPAVDSCSDNMHDLAGYLLEYYVLHKGFPETLDALSPLADADRKVSATCPVSAKPYLYFPGGLQPQGQKQRLVVCDPTPIHNGSRWAIVSIPPEGNTPIGLWVVRLDEKTLQTYHLP